MEQSESQSKDITVLAVTKMHGGVCTAGIDESGSWVRPIRPASEQRGAQGSITDYCLLPIDFFHGGNSHLVNMGVSRVWLAEPRPVAPHTEDWIIDLARKPQSLRKLSAGEQAAFLAANAEPGPGKLEEWKDRSLGLFRPERFSFQFGMNKLGEDVIVRASFRAGGRELNDVGCTDLRMRALGRMLLRKSGEPNAVLTDRDFQRRGKQETYLAIGLSRLYRGRHWPILVGVHSVPELEVEVDYARL